MAIPKRAVGIVIEPLIGPKVVALGFQFLGLVVGAALVIAWLTEIPLPWPSGDIHVRWWGGIMGVALWVVTPLPMLGVLAVLKVGERMIIADNRLQVAQRSGLVTIQFPFANVAKVAIVRERTAHFLGIDLKNLDDPETCASGWDLAIHKERYGWHFTLHGGFKHSIDDIHRLLVERMPNVA